MFRVFLAYFTFIMAVETASFQGKRDFQCFNPADPYSGVHCQDVYEQIYLRGIDSPCNEKWFGLSCCNFCTNKGEKPVFECKDDNTDCRSYRIWKDSKKTIRRYFLARYCFDTIFCRPDSTTLLSTTTASTTTDAAPSTTTATATTIAATATATPAASTTVTAAIASTTTGKLIANEITSDEAHISFTSSNNYTQAKPSTTFPVVDTNRNESATDISESIVDFNTTLSNQKYDLRVRH